jgi:hypothetical protein
MPMKEIPPDRRIGFRLESDQSDCPALGAASIRFAIRIGSDGEEARR